MKWVLVLSVSILFLTLSTTAQNFDFLYFIQKWPGSYCNKQHCCFPSTGKPASDFVVYRLEPYSNLGSAALNCTPSTNFDPSKISNLTQLQREWPYLGCKHKNGVKQWSEVWAKYGTCSQSVLDQRAYFDAAINLKKKVNLLQILENAGIKPDGKYYDLSRISDAIISVTGHEAGIQCNINKSGDTQLSLIYMCSDVRGSQIIECPGLPIGTCRNIVKFPPF